MSNQHPRMPAMPDFKDFYRAINGRAPFPWQARLAQQVAEESEWPAEIGVPTGLGKTACLDIAVWWLASQGHSPPAQRSAPTRIWWVVNRRLLVDEASRHAESIQALLRDPYRNGQTAKDAEVLCRVADRLRSLTSPLASEPLHVTPLRGGIALRRPPNPVQPSVIVSTIAMYGSRLLFRGYGASRSMRPIDAALAGTDSLVLVDEAHLARHLRDLVPKLRLCMPGTVTGVLPASRSSPQVASLTATGDASGGDRFDLDEDDYANATICARLDADKPVKIDAAPKGDPAKALRDAAIGLVSDADQPSSLVIFCNTPALARDVFGLLKSHKLCADADLMLVTGRTRQLDSDALKKRLLSPTEGTPALAGARPTRQRHLVVVATQTLEVGADLDFEYLVTEQCGVRALTQRLGRLNRLGLHQHARAVYVHRPPRRSRSSSDPDEDLHSGALSGGWPVYGSEPDVVLEHLERGGIPAETNLSPRVIAEHLGEPGDDPGRAPEVLPDLLWEWVKTTTPPHGEAPVEPYFSGISEARPTASVLWRIYLPTAIAPAAGPSAEDGDEPSDGAPTVPRLWPHVRQDEVIEVPLGELRAALRNRRIEQVHRVSDGGTVDLVPPRDLRPGDAVILPSAAGMCDEFGWDTAGTDRVVDLSVKGAGLPLDRQALTALCGSSTGEIDAEVLSALRGARGDGEEEPDEDQMREAAASLISMLRERDMFGFEPDDKGEFLDALDPTPVRPPGEVPRLAVRSPEETARLDESDEASLCDTLPPEAMELEAHGAAVADRAELVSTALGLSAELTAVIAQAGKFHDLGKADARFQRWLNPGVLAAAADSDYTPLAKSDMPRPRWSAARADAGWPTGGRHEELSARLVNEWISARANGLDADDQDLLIHLVVSHHGKGRPLVTPVADGTPETVRWSFDDGTEVNVPADLSQTDWDQPARFRRLNENLGPWGLALLETIVRQADHEMSAATEVQ